MTKPTKMYHITDNNKIVAVKIYGSGGTGHCKVFYTSPELGARWCGYIRASELALTPKAAIKKLDRKLARRVDRYEKLLLGAKAVRHDCVRNAERKFGVSISGPIVDGTPFA